MANIDNTTLWADNQEKFDEITAGIAFPRQRHLEREPGKLFLQTAWGVPHEEIRELSAKHPDMALTAIHSFDHSFHDELFTVEYNAGQDRVLKVEPSYMVDCVPEEVKKRVPCYEVLEEKLFEVCKRLDVEREDPEKGKFVSWVQAEVTITVEHGGYKMRATKSGHSIEDVSFMKAVEVKETRWEPVTENGDEVPF